jgi:hypothetical protein
MYTVNIIYLFMALAFDALFQFLDLYTVGRLLRWGISPSQGRYLHTE